MSWELDIHGLTTWQYDRIYRQGVHIVDDPQVAAAARRVHQGITVRELEEPTEEIPFEETLTEETPSEETPEPEEETVSDEEDQKTDPEGDGSDDGTKGPGTEPRVRRAR